jgi:hypothetical protein
MGESPGSGRDRTSAPRRRSAFLWAAGVGVVVMALAGIALFLTVGNNPIVPAQASPGSDASLPTIVDGRGVLTVLEAIGRRDAGVLGDDPVAIVATGRTRPSGTAARHHVVRPAISRSIATIGSGASPSSTSRSRSSTGAASSPRALGRG